ncbi:MAG TPA: hypothetical protein VH113_03460, partial [Gemmatimonadales bacterium]|nr:hypothetical protein [Gemmatimonadales bacterium]
EALGLAVAPELREMERRRTLCDRTACPGVPNSKPRVVQRIVEGLERHGTREMNLNVEVTRR